MTIVEAERTVLAGKNYELSEELNKINIFWANNDITQSERDELVELAKTNADPDSELPAYADRISALELAVADLQSRVASLEGTAAAKEKFPLWTKPATKAQYAHTGSTYSYDADGDGTVEYYLCLLTKAQDAIGDAYNPTVYKGHWKQVTLSDDIDALLAAWKADEKNGYVTTSESAGTTDTTTEEKTSTVTSTNTATESTDTTTSTTDSTTDTTTDTADATTETTTGSTDTTTSTADTTTAEK